MDFNVDNVANEVNEDKTFLNTSMILNNERIKLKSTKSFNYIH